MSEPRVDPDIVPAVRTIVVVLGALLLLTAATVLVASLDLPPEVHVAAAIGIAAVKAALVALYFMHLAHEGRLIRVVVLASIALLATLLLFVLVDIANRGA